MDTELIIISEYCLQNNIEPDFIIQLEDEGLIEIHIIDNQKYIPISELKNLDQYARWYYELSINIAGIDVIKNLLDKMNDMQNEINRLRERLRLID